MNKKILLKTLLPIAAVALLGGGIASSLTLTSCSNKSEKALEIDVSTPKNINNGTTLNIIGSYKAFNFNSPTIDFASGTPEWFSVLSVDEDNKTFATTLNSDAPIGDYDLRLVAATGNDNVFSNKITFTVGPFATSDGSNWSGHISGIVRMTLNDDMTATISESGGYVAENLVIPEYVFGNGKFYKVTIISNYAFENCVGLTGSLTIPNSMISIGERAFVGCSGLTGSLTIGSGVTSIGVRAFYGCSGLTGNLTIPDSVTSIGDRAFLNCSGLTGSLTIGSGAGSISDLAFWGCNFDNIDINSANPTYGLADNVGAAQIVVEKKSDGTCKKNYGSNDIIGSLAIGQLTIDDDVNSIGYEAFYYCNRLTGSLTIPDNVTSIEYAAFMNCTNLIGSLTVPDSVNSIGAYAFASCSGLTESLTIGSGVASIGIYAFEQCSGFTNITLNGYSSSPSWSAEPNIFDEWNNDSTSTVSTSNGSLTASDALLFLESKGLPSNWTAA